MRAIPIAIKNKPSIWTKKGIFDMSHRFTAKYHTNTKEIKEKEPAISRMTRIALASISRTTSTNNQMYPEIAKMLPTKISKMFISIDGKLDLSQSEFITEEIQGLSLKRTPANAPLAEADRGRSRASRS
jgi:hypothetical protein